MHAKTTANLKFIYCIAKTMQTAYFYLVQGRHYGTVFLALLFKGLQALRLISR